jgi:sec-independent protein translocase protein TatA
MDLIIVGVIVLLLFGNRLPSVMRSLGRGVVEFKKGVSGIEDELEEATRVSSSKRSEAIEEAPKASSTAEAEAKKTEV